MNNKIRHCSNCVFWSKKTGRYGLCCIITELSSIRFAATEQSEGGTYVMVPRYAVCDDHVFKKEIYEPDFELLRQERDKLKEQYTLLTKKEARNSWGITGLKERIEYFNRTGQLIEY